MSRSVRSMSVHVEIADTGGLGSVTVRLGEGGGPITPASRITARALGRNARLLLGRGIDWGCGTGLLGILAARVPTVTGVVAIDVDPLAVANARHNVSHAGVVDRVTVIRADLFEAWSDAERSVLADLRGSAGFLVANPPASDDGDGLGWRRRLLDGAVGYLAPGAVGLIQISSHYGRERIEGLVTDVPGYRYRGRVEASDRVEFDLKRPDLRRALDVYVAAERAGHPDYRFGTASGETLSATRIASGAGIPLTRWEVHRFDRVE